MLIPIIIITTTTTTVVLRHWFIDWSSLCL